MFVVTGASGFVGRNAVYSLPIIDLKKYSDKYLFCGTSNRRISLENSKVEYYVNDMSTLNSCNPMDCTGLLHMAFLNRSYIKRLGLSEYFSVCANLSNNVFQFAKRTPGSPIVIISSGCAASPHIPSHSKPYDYMKREEEILFSQLSKDHMVLIFRLYAAVGHFDDKPSRFALGQFIQSSLAHNLISIQSDSYVYRSYIYLKDLLSLCWNILSRPLSNGLYIIDACAENFELQEIAECVSGALNAIPIIRPNLAPSPVNSYTGNSLEFKSLFYERFKKQHTPIMDAINNIIVTRTF